MNEFRTNLKLQNLFIAICSFVLAAFSFLSAASEAGLINFLQASAGDSHWQSMWRGMIAGVSVGLLIVLIAFLVRNILALADEQKLKKLYVETHDERQIKIWTSARSAAMQIFLIGGVVVGIVAGYFSITVSITIFACLFVHSMIGLMCSIYFKIKL